MKTRLERLVLLRHGETVGQSSIRYYGATDVALSDVGREQVLRAAARLADERFDVVYSSSLSRAVESAKLVASDRRVHYEIDFREVDFGRWEGLTREEIAVRDPELFPIWQANLARFDYPEGEARADFRARIARGLDRLLAVPARSALVVAHKGVVRTLLELVAGETLPADEPELGGIVRVVRGADGYWRGVRPDGDAGLR